MKSNFDEGRPYKIKIHTGNKLIFAQPIKLLIKIRIKTAITTVDKQFIVTLTDLRIVRSLPLLINPCRIAQCVLSYRFFDKICIDIISTTPSY